MGEEDREEVDHGKGGGGGGEVKDIAADKDWYRKIYSEKIVSQDLTVLRLAKSHTVYPFPSLR